MRARPQADVDVGLSGAGGGPGGAGEVWVALCTAPDAEVAERLGRRAVEEGRAACANLVPEVRSVFRWEGEVQSEAEVLIVFKTTRAAYPALAALIRTAHPYEVPELIAWPLAAGLEPYLAWVRESSGGGPPPKGGQVATEDVT